MMGFLGILLIHQEGSEQHRKRECLKSAISIRHICKSQLLPGKWTQQKVDKATDETINKTCTEYKQPELTQKNEITEKALGKHIMNLYSTGISRLLKIMDVNKLRKDIENDPIIKDQVVLQCVRLAILLRLFQWLRIQPTTQILIMNLKILKTRVLKVIKKTSFQRFLYLLSRHKIFLIKNK